MMPGMTWTAVLWFVAIVAMIPLALWVLKRTPMGGAASGPGAPRTVAVMPLSAQQRLVTVEVGQGEERLWLVLGVTPHGIRTLHTMAPQTPAAPATPQPPAAAFAQLLGRMRGSDGNRDER
jgi:flagellar protein FliO/FliZ